MPSRVAEILLEQGRQAAEAARARGAVWGNAVENLSQIPGQVMAQRQQQQRQALQNQVTQQGLAVGAEQLRGLQDVHRDQSLYADVVGKNTSTDPETGHVVFNNDAILQGLASRPNALERWTDFSTKFQEHSDKAQLDHLALEGTKNTLLTDMLGGVLSAPPEQQADIYAARSGALKGILKNDPRVAQLPPVYDQKQVQALHDSFLTEGQRLAQAKDKAALAKENRVTTKPGETVVDVSQIDPTTGQPKVVASGGADPVVAERERHNKEMERVNALREGKEAAAQAETARHNRELEKHAATTAANTKLTKVVDRDPVTGQSRVRYLPQSELAGQTFQAPVSATVENRLASAQAVNQTGEDIIAKLKDPAIAAKVGPAMGRFNTLRDFIGNPPPELAEIAGSVESYALANMGVHGMRSAQGAEQIKKLLDQKHTPASLIATIQGLNKFSSHFMENEGRGTTKAPKEIVYDANGQPVKP